MDFETDLIDIVKRYFAAEGICYEDQGDAADFAARYWEMRKRRLAPKPRRVHFSNELHDSLGNLARETDPSAKDNAQIAWNAVFKIRWLLTRGQCVVQYLSKSVNDATTKDRLLWDFAMYHFHLNDQLEPAAFIKRSDYLLFAIVGDEDVYVVDVRKHHDPQKILWVRQELLKIVDANWPELTDASVLHGVQGNQLTDEEKGALRAKNVNHVTTLRGRAIMPLGKGMAGDSSSIFGRYWADKLMHEIEAHKSWLSDHLAEYKTAFQAQGVDIADENPFRLVLLDSLELSAEDVETLRGADCLNCDLSRMGFATVESKSRWPIC
jgi:hypothetical protein